MVSPETPLILIVDDHADTRQLLARLLTLTGYRTAAVAGGHEALVYLNDHRPDLLILDRMMPGIDGLEVLRTMRADARFREIPVLVYSAAADADHHEDARRFGAQASIIKGTGWDHLMREIEHLAGPATKVL